MLTNYPGCGPSLARACASAGVFLLTSLWAARFFSENYLTLVVALLAVGYVLSQENPKPQDQILKQIQSPKFQ